MKPLLDSRLASWPLRIFIVFWRLSQNFYDLHTFSYISRAFHIFSKNSYIFILIFHGFHTLSLIASDFNIFHRSSEISRNPGAWMFEPWHGPKIRLAALMKTFARFQAGFLGSDDFHQIMH